MMDMYGQKAMFIGFAVCLSFTILVMLSQMPNQGAKKEQIGPGDPMRSSFELLWFFSNLLVYGGHMALVETFLFVYLAKDFGASKLLLGTASTVMCIFELPVFFYSEQIFKRFSLTTLLSICQIIFAGRCFGYSILPTEAPWLVLLLEPLHGITFALMWSCSVELGSQLAPTGKEARMQALVGGLYYRVAIGTGSMLWGLITRPPPLGCNFRVAYFMAAFTMILWAVVWNVFAPSQRRILCSCRRSLNGIPQEQLITRELTIRN